jgi:hypothetical protein
MVSNARRRGELRLSSGRRERASASQPPTPAAAHQPRFCWLLAATGSRIKVLELSKVILKDHWLRALKYWMETNILLPLVVCMAI